MASKVHGQWYERRLVSGSRAGLWTLGIFRVGHWRFGCIYDLLNAKLFKI